MGRVRPRFVTRSSAAPDQVIAAFGKSLNRPQCPVSGVAAPGRLEFHVHGDEQRLWSPQLIVEVAPGESGSTLWGRFGPHPSVWTMYTVSYGILGFGALVGASFGYAQWVMETTQWGWWVIAGCALSAVALYALAFVGQGLGRIQMDRLRDFLDLELRQLGRDP